MQRNTSMQRNKEHKILKNEMREKLQWQKRDKTEIKVAEKKGETWNKKGEMYINLKKEKVVMDREMYVPTHLTKKVL